MNNAGLSNCGQSSSVHSSGKPPNLGRESESISIGNRNVNGEVGNKFVRRNCRIPLFYASIVGLEGGWTSSYFARRSSASLRFVSFASVIAFIASTYFLKVGDNSLEIGAFSIETSAVGISGFCQS